jgi:hypothetical protein
VQLRNILVFAAASYALLAVDASYVGAWKLNMAKSNMAGTTVTYRQTPAGEWEATSDGVTYRFKMDGGAYPDKMGDTAAWKSIDANTWQTTWKVNGRTLYTDTLRLGADGLLTVESKGTKPNGEAMDDTSVFQRLSGGPGLAGRWQSKTAQSSSPAVIELTASGNSGLTYKDTQFGTTCEAKLDGKDYPCSGPARPAGWSVSMVKIGPNSFTATIKKDAKPLYRYTYTPSPDGKTLTVSGGATGTNEKIKMVYDRVQ